MREEQFSAAIGDWTLEAPHPRFGIYLNNVASALITALGVRYPVTEQLVGHDFFSAMAGAYAQTQRPSSAVLIGYGETFPAFIQAFEPAGGVPYLADVAGLESLWWQAYHATDAASLQASDFAAVASDDWGGMRFAFHPSLGLFHSPFAVGSIWQAHRGGPPMGSFDLSSAESVLVARPHMAVDLRIISPASLDFVSRLRNGACLADAVEAASQAHPDFDLPSQLKGLIALNIITGLRP